MPQIVECPKCALRFEPFEVLSGRQDDVFCPQCGNHFDARTVQEEEKAA